MKAKIVLEILKEEKSISQIASPYGIHPSILNRWKNGSRNSLPSTDDTKRRDHTKAEYEKKIQDLYTEIGRLTTELAWLKKRVASELGRDKRLDLVEWNHPEISLRKQAELLNLNRSSLFSHPVPPSPAPIPSNTASTK